MSSSSPLRIQSYNFAVSITLLCKTIIEKEREFVLTKQLLKSATSIAANVEEAQQPQSRKDFIAKFSIALKEGYESRFWIRLMKDSGYLSSEKALPLLRDLDGIIGMLSSSIGTAKKNLSSQ